jgi:pyrroloquinoline-quinone synthase
VRKRNEATGTKRSELLARIDGAIAERSLLKHPFYRDWQAGTLRRERLRLYAAQYYVHVEAFPVHLEDLADRARGDLRVLVLENLAEEEDVVAPHPKLWRDFAAALGVSGETLWTISPLPGIRRLVETYRQICGERSFPEAVAALYAYEAQVPEISTTKMEGLRRHYGVNTAQGLAYFQVHEEADRVHRRAWRNWLEGNTATATDEGRVLATTQEALKVLWGALDSVQAAPC